MTKQMRSIEIEITEIVIYFSVLIWELNRLRSQLLFCLIIIIVIYATSFCVNWAFLIARGTRLKHKRSEGFKVSRSIEKPNLLFKFKAISAVSEVYVFRNLKVPILGRTGLSQLKLIQFSQGHLVGHLSQ
jgi:uncharacterized membrane protein YedE/YeeE